MLDEFDEKEFSIEDVVVVVDDDFDDVVFDDVVFDDVVDKSNELSHLCAKATTSLSVVRNRAHTTTLAVLLVASTVSLGSVPPHSTLVRNKRSAVHSTAARNTFDDATIRSLVGWSRVRN